jgi:hypothetical protein
MADGPNLTQGEKKFVGAFAVSAFIVSLGL